MGRSDYLQVLSDSVAIEAAVGRQIESFLDVSYFVFVHKESFGEPDNPVVSDYKVTKTARGWARKELDGFHRRPL